MNYSDLGKRVRYVRRARNITQDVLARQAGISPSFLGHIERGTRKASIETLVKLACALGTGTDELLQDYLVQKVPVSNHQDSPTAVLVYPYYVR